MNKGIFSPALSLLTLLLLCGTPALAAETAPGSGLAVVDTERLLQESQPGQAGEAHLQKVRDVLQKGLNELQNIYKGKENTAEAKQALREGYVALERQMAVERQAVLQVLGKNMGDAIRVWRNANPQYTAVMARQNLLDNAPTLDVTAAVMPEMNKQKPEFPALPKVTVNTPPTKEKKEKKERDKDKEREKRDREREREKEKEMR